MRIPRKPASRNIEREGKNSSSLKIRYSEMKIRMNGSMSFMVFAIDGRMYIKRGMKKSMIGRAIREP